MRVAAIAAAADLPHKCSQIPFLKLLLAPLGMNPGMAVPEHSNTSTSGREATSNGVWYRQVMTITTA